MSEYSVKDEIRDEVLRTAGYAALWAAGAANTIRESGWIQEEAQNDDGFCLLGALNYQNVDMFDHIAECEPEGFGAYGFGAYDVWLEVLGRVDAAIHGSRDGSLLWPEGRIEDWNDADGRTEDEVLEVLEKAARQ